MQQKVQDFIKQQPGFAGAGHSIYTKVSKIHYKCLDITQSFR